MQIYIAFAALVHAELTCCNDDDAVANASNVNGAVYVAADDERVFDVFQIECGEWSAACC